MDNDFKNRFDKFKAGASTFMKEKGIYLVLTVCLAVVAIAAVLIFMDTGENEQKEALETPDSAVSQSEDETLQNAVNRQSPSPAITVAPTVTPSIAPATTIPDFTAKPKATPTPKPKKTKASAPVQGGILWGYAVDELIYSETLKQWMTHAGVDLEAKQGDEVHAVLGGTIDKVYEDSAFGWTVVISHSSKQTSIYANLKKEVPVKEGQKVSAADVIGHVGDTAISECGIKSHLHFEFLINGKSVDPADYVLITK